MKRKKIEKLDYLDYWEREELVHSDVIIEMAVKINEIIDTLNAKEDE